MRIAKSGAGAALTSLTAAACMVLAGCEQSPVDPSESIVPVDSLLSEAIAVVPNPSGIAPLTALATVRTRTPTRVTVRLLNVDSLTHRDSTVATEHEVALLGLLPGEVNRVEVRIEDVAGRTGLDTLSVATDPLPDLLPTIEVRTADRAAMEPGWTLASFSAGLGDNFQSHPFIFDERGRVRWYLDLSAFPFLIFTQERLRNGNLIIGAASSLYEYDFLGRTVHRWDFPGYVFHHDVYEKPDGNFVVLVDKVGTGTVEDHVIEVNRSTGAIERVWDLRQVMDVSRREPLGTDYDWFHANSVWYDERDSTIVVSGRTQAVVKLTMDNRLVWILAPHRGWGRAGTDGTGPNTADFVLTAVDAGGHPYPEAVQRGEERTPDFDWPWLQHATMVLPNGNLFLFDNGQGRNFRAVPAYSRGVEYRIDAEARTIQQVWDYGESRGTEFYSTIISDVDYLPKTTNRLISPGIVTEPSPHAYVTEVTYPGGRVVFDARLSLKNLRSGGGNGWGEFDLVYRTERISLYPGEK